MANPESAFWVEQSQQEISEKRLFLSQKQERNNDLVQTIQELESRIWELAKNIGITDEKLAAENDALGKNEAELGVTNKRIGEINDIVGKNQKSIEGKTTQGKKIDNEITELEKQKSSPGNFEAVGTNITALKPETPEIDKKIAEKKAEKAKIESEIQALIAENTKLSQEKSALEIKAKELETTITANKEEIARLTQLRQEQKAEENNLTKEKDDDQEESNILLSEIEWDIRDIERIAGELASARSMYERNLAMESPGKRNLFEQMSSDFIGVLA